MYDVCVIGAGPAGLSTGYYSAKNNLKTIIFEEHSTIGEPLQCAEGLPRFALKDLNLVLKNYNEIDKIFLYTPSLKKIDINFPKPSDFLIISRKELEQKLAKKAVDAGTELQIFTKVKDIQPQSDYVSIKTYSGWIKSKYVALCTGPNSNLAEKIGFPTNKNPESFVSCAQALICTNDLTKNIAEIYIGKNIAPYGYAWVFPKNSHIANVGLGISKCAGSFEKLQQFLKYRFEKYSIIGLICGVVPIYWQSKKLAQKRCVVVGDVARQVSPLTGGGVRFALHSGKCASIAFEKNNLESYEYMVKRDFRKLFAISEVFKEIAQSCNDTELDRVLTTIGDFTIPQYRENKDLAILAFEKLIPLLAKNTFLVKKLFNRNILRILHRFVM